MTLFQRLGGQCWRLSRQIDDRRAKSQARFEGTAILRPVSEGHAIYEETGKLHLGGTAPLVSTRRYDWREAGDGIDTYFEDGRFFHHIPAEGGTAGHFCAPDQYDVNYDFSGWPEWQATWSVSGPRKDYSMTTHYLPEV